MFITSFSHVRMGLLMLLPDIPIASCCRSLISQLSSKRMDVRRDQLATWQLIMAGCYDKLYLVSTGAASLLDQACCKMSRMFLIPVPWGLPIVKCFRQHKKVTKATVRERVGRPNPIVNEKFHFIC